MKRYPRLTVYRAADGWRWNYRAANGRIMADSAEAYARRTKCVGAAFSVFGLLPEDGIGSHINGAPTTREGWAPMVVSIEGLPR